MISKSQLNFPFLHIGTFSTDGENEYRPHGGGPAASLSAADRLLYLPVAEG